MRSCLTGRVSTFSQNCHERNCLNKGFSAPMWRALLRPELGCHKRDARIDFSAEEPSVQIISPQTKISFLSITPATPATI